MNKDEIKDKYYFEFLVNFINKNSNVLGETDLRTLKIEQLEALAKTYTDDVEHKWILSDENYQYLSELAKNDKTCPMARVMISEEPKVMEDVPELNKEEIMKKISDSPDLSSYSTKELFDELIKRGGVEAHWLNPESHYSLDIERPDSCHDTIHFNGRGPVWIIFNYD